MGDLYVTYKVSDFAKTGIKGRMLGAMSDKRDGRYMPSQPGIFISEEDANYPLLKQFLEELTGNEAPCPAVEVPKPKRKHSHYYKDVANLDQVDVYRVCDKFEVHDKSGAVQHAIKKLLLAGRRGGGKDYYKDIKEAADSLNRKLEMRQEDLDGGIPI